MKVLALGTAAFMTMTGVAFADGFAVDGDNLAGGPNIAATCAAATNNGTATITYNGGSHYSAGESLNIQVSTPAGSGITSAPTAATNKIAAVWNTNGQTTTFGISTSVPANVASGTYKVDYTVTGAASGRTLSDFFNVVVNCAAPADATKPTISLSHTVDGLGGWNVTSPVAVSVIASDNVALASVSCTVDGIATAITPALTGSPTSYSGSIAVSGDGTHAVSCTATDTSSNSQDASDTVNIDTVKPTIIHSVDVSAAPSGWYITAPTVTFECTDATSGVASCVADGESGPSKTLGESATAQTVSGTAQDNAGWTSTDSAVGLLVDLSDPVITCPSPAPSFILHESGSLTANITDAISGVASPTVSVGVDTSSAGLHTVNVTGYDIAGRSATASCSYVVGYNFVGFFQPINDPAGSNPSTFKSGSTVPVKFALADINGVRIDDASAQAIADACGAKFSYQYNPGDPGAVDETISSNPANTGDCFRYDAANDQFIFNWGTKGRSAGKYSLTARITMSSVNLAGHTLNYIGLR